MSQTAMASMNCEEFFAWQEKQEGLYELVDGFPLQMMSGSKRRHDRITVSIVVALDRKLQGRACQPTTQDTGIKISTTQVRRPEVMIDCGATHDDAYVASDPRVVFEVLSRYTRQFDQTKKFEEYKTVASLTAIVLIDADNAEVIAYQRDSAGTWITRNFAGLGAEIDFPDLGLHLSLAEIYRNLAFRPKPAPVMGQ